MKVCNVSDKIAIPMTVDFLLRKKDGTDSLFTLKPGEIIYGEVYQMNNTLIIYERKNYVKISDVAKPTHLDYYKVYHKSDVIEEKETPIIDKKIIESEVLETKQKTLNKKGAGRPKGSINKKATRGRPKGVKNKKSKNKKTNFEEAKSNAEKYINAK